MFSFPHFILPLHLLPPFPIFLHLLVHSYLVPFVLPVHLPKQINDGKYCISLKNVGVAAVRCPVTQDYSRYVLLVRSWLDSQNWPTWDTVDNSFLTITTLFFSIGNIPQFSFLSSVPLLYPLSVIFYQYLSFSPNLEQLRIFSSVPIMFTAFLFSVFMSPSGYCLEFIFYKLLTANSYGS